MDEWKSSSQQGEVRFHVISHFIVNETSKVRFSSKTSFWHNFINYRAIIMISYLIQFFDTESIKTTFKSLIRYFLSPYTYGNQIRWEPLGYGNRSDSFPNL